MRSLDFKIDGVEMPVPIEQLFLTSIDLRGHPVFLRAPTGSLTVNASIEIMGRPFSSAPTLVYVALSDGIYVGVGAVYQAGEPVTSDKVLAYRWGDKPISGCLWRWRDVADHWESIILTSAKLNKRLCPRFRASLALFPTPEAVFCQLMRDCSHVALPGAVVMCASPFCGLPVKNQDAFEIKLMDEIHGKTIEHRYDLVQVD